MHIQKGSPPTLPLSFGPWELSPVLLPISSDLSQGCSSDIFPPFVMLPSRTSSSGLMSPPLILMTLAASIAGSCWMISSHCPGLLVEGTSVFSCELPLVLWKALTDSPHITLTISMLQSFLHLLHRVRNSPLETLSGHWGCFASKQRAGSLGLVEKLLS